MAPRAVALLLAVLAVAAAASSPARAAAPPVIKSFWVVDSNTFKWLRRLADGDVLTEPHGSYTIVALSSAGARWPVQWTAPAALRNSSSWWPPFRAWRWREDPLGSVVGNVTFSARVVPHTGGPGPTASVRVVLPPYTPTPTPPPTPSPSPEPTTRPGLRCAHPWPTPPPSVRGVPAPTAAPAHAPDDLPVPTVGPHCAGVQPRFTEAALRATQGDLSGLFLTATGCPNSTVRVSVYVTGGDGVSAARRVEQFTAPFGASGTVPTRFARLAGNPRFAEAWETPRLCGKPHIFATLCAIPPGGCVEECVRSVDQQQTRSRPPALTFAPDGRPPLVLALAPGDAAVVRFGVANEGGLDMVGVLRSPDGSNCRTPLLSGSRLDVQLTHLTCAAGVTAAANGSFVGLEYSASGCGSVVGTSTLRTRLHVGDDVDPLVVQDAHPPSSVVVIYPRTRVGDPVTLSVTFVNDGGGRRRNRRTGQLTATAPHFQWWQEELGHAQVVYGVKLDGQTGPTLRTRAAKSWARCSNDDGDDCYGLTGYIVDVCNTAGCTQARVSPNAFRRF